MNIEDVTKQAELTNFDEAKEASENDFNAPEVVEEQPIVEDPQATEEPTEIEEQAIQTAEVATQAAVDTSAQLQQIMQELTVIKEENTNLKNVIQQQTKQQEENIIEEVMEPPVLDINGLMYDDEETARNKVSDYSKNIFEFAKQGVLKEIQPYIEQVKQTQLANEKAEVINTLSQVPELAGFKEMLPQIETIIKNNPILQNANPEEAYVNAYMISKGVSASSEQPKQQTPEDILELIKQNPEAQKLYEQQRVESLKNSQQVPAFTSSSGAVNAALNIKDKPTTFDEASKRTREMFGEI